MATATAVAVGLLLAPAAFAGTNDNVTGWAWSGSIGWISMNCTNDASCGTSNYGVTITESPGFSDRGDLKGWAWSETVGWICFGITCSGTTPEGGVPYAQYRANFNGKGDQFWGWAQVLSLGDNGWIALNCDHDVGPDDCATSNYYLILNNFNGTFTTGGANDHWGWGINGWGGSGWIDFSIVNTSWTLAKLGLIVRPQGVFEPNTATSTFACTTDADCGTHAPYVQCTKAYGPYACASDSDCTSHSPYTRCDAAVGNCYSTDKCGLPGTHMQKFTINFPSMSGALNQLLECEILLPDGSRRVVNKVLTSAVRNGVPATSLSYTLQGADTVQPNRIWYLDVCRIAGSAFGAACATDADCGANKICDESAGKCRDVIEQSNKRKPIYTHGNAWTGLDASQDQYLAIKCNAGFPNNYFKNAAQCDFTGDASFSLAMRRGFPVEGDCGDLIDNDGNGQVDCADRYCKGISYRCQTLKRTTCVWGQSADGMNDCTDVSYQNGDLCCTKQPVSAGASLSHVVDGLECTHGDPDDGYFDCDCNAGKFGTYADCFSPGYTSGDLCCDANNQVVKQ